jgi:hypothetical protein
MRSDALGLDSCLVEGQKRGKQRDGRLPKMTLGCRDNDQRREELSPLLFAALWVDRRGHDSKIILWYKDPARVSVRGDGNRKRPQASSCCDPAVQR